MEEKAKGNESLGSDLKKGWRNPASTEGTGGCSSCSSRVEMEREVGGGRLNRLVQPPRPPFKLEETGVTGSTGGSRKTPYAQKGIRTCARVRLMAFEVRFGLWIDDSGTMVLHTHLDENKTHEKS